LKARGHDAVAPNLPFDDPAATYEDRARAASMALDGVEGPVVIVGHSVGSARLPSSPPSDSPRCS
jgi:hypothetical protein